MLQVEEEQEEVLHQLESVMNKFIQQIYLDRNHASKQALQRIKLLATMEQRRGKQSNREIGHHLVINNTNLVSMSEDHPNILLIKRI